MLKSAIILLAIMVSGCALDYNAPKLPDERSHNIILPTSSSDAPDPNHDTLQYGHITQIIDGENCLAVIDVGKYNSVGQVVWIKGMPTDQLFDGMMLSGLTENRVVGDEITRYESAFGVRTVRMLHVDMTRPRD